MSGCKLLTAVHAIFMLTCFPAAAEFIDTWMEPGDLIDLLDDLTNQQCGFPVSCSNQSRHLKDDQLCCFPCECYKSCIINDMCCHDLFNFTNHETNSSNAKDIITETYYTMRGNGLNLRYDKIFNRTIDQSLEEFVDVTGILERASCTSIYLHANTIESLYTDARYLVVSCPEMYPKYSESHLRCKGLLNGTELADIIPETSVNTSITYKNRHCRMCNEPNSSYVPWGMNLYCLRNTHLQIPHFLNLEDVIAFDANESRCSILFQPSEDFEGVTFTPRCIDIHVSSCNLSGKWEIYDADIDLACQTIYSPVFAIIKDFTERLIFFQNVACFVCNSNEHDSFGMPCNPSGLRLKEATSSENAVSVMLFADNADTGFILRNGQNVTKLAETNKEQVCKFFVENQIRCRSSSCPMDYWEDEEMCLPIYGVLDGINVEIKVKVKFERNFFMFYLPTFEETIADTFISYFSNHAISFCSVALWRKFTDDSKKEIDYFFYHLRIKTDFGVMYSSIRSAIEMLVKQNEPFGKIPDFDNKPVTYTVAFADHVIVDETKYRTAVSDSSDGQPLLKSSVKFQFDQFYDSNSSVTILIGQTCFCERVVLYPKEFKLKNNKLIILPMALVIPIGKFEIDGDRVIICIEDLSRTVLNTANSCAYFGNSFLILPVAFLWNKI